MLLSKVSLILGNKINRDIRSLLTRRKSRVFVVAMNHFSDLTVIPDITPVDRLLRVKPMLSEDEDENYDDRIQNSDDEEMDENDPYYKLGRHLLSLGRIRYRHIESIPDWINERRQEIFQHRTSAQIRRCMKNWMLKPDRDIQRDYFGRSLYWNPKSPPTEKAFMAFGPEETIAYVNYFFPSRYAITKRIMSELKTLLPKYKPTSILDFGCGPGTAGAAAQDVWGDEIRFYTGVDVSQSMTDAAKVMLNILPSSSKSASASASTIDGDELSTGIKNSKNHGILVSYIFKASYRSQVLGGGVIEAK